MSVKLRVRAIHAAATALMLAVVGVAADAPLAVTAVALTTVAYAAELAARRARRRERSGPARR